MRGQFRRRWTRWTSLAVLIIAGCYPLVRRGTPAALRLTLEPLRSTEETLHVALTVVNRSDDEIWVRSYGNGPTVQIRDAAGRERCVPPPVPPRVHIGSEVRVQARLAGGVTFTLRRQVALRELTDCAPGRYTLTAGTEVTRPKGAARTWSLSKRASLTIVPPPSVR